MPSTKTPYCYQYAHFHWKLQDYAVEPSSVSSSAGVSPVPPESSVAEAEVGLEHDEGQASTENAEDAFHVSRHMPQVGLRLLPLTHQCSVRC